MRRHNLSFLSNRRPLKSNCHLSNLNCVNSLIVSFTKYVCPGLILADSSDARPLRGPQLRLQLDQMQAKANFASVHNPCHRRARAQPRMHRPMKSTHSDGSDYITQVHLCSPGILTSSRFPMPKYMPRSPVCSFCARLAPYETRAIAVSDGAGVVAVTP